MNSPRLGAIQKQFSDAIYHQSFMDGIVQKGIPSEDRIGVYRGNVMLSIIDALQHTFPTIYSVVGDAFFKIMMKEFITKHPPKTACLFDYGYAFPEFIRSYKPASSLPYLTGIAHLDWAHHQAYHHDDVPALDPRHLKNMDESAYIDLTLKLHPTVHLLHSKYAIDKIWQEGQKDDHDHADNDDRIYIDQPVWLLIYRKNYHVAMHHLCPGGFTMLKHMKAQKSLHESLESALQVEADFHFQEEMARWLAIGIFTKAISRGKDVE